MDFAVLRYIVLRLVFRRFVALWLKLLVSVYESRRMRVGIGSLHTVQHLMHVTNGV